MTTVTIRSIVYTLIDGRKAYVGKEGKVDGNGHTSGTNAEGEIFIPSTIFVNKSTFRVTTVSAYAFRHSKITRVIIQDGIKTLCDRSFNECHYLEEVILPGSITLIETCTFGHAHALMRAIIQPSKNRIKIDSSAFSCDYILEEIYICSRAINTDKTTFLSSNSELVIYKRRGVSYTYSQMTTEVSDYCDLPKQSSCLTNRKKSISLEIFIFIVITGT